MTSAKSEDFKSKVLQGTLWSAIQMWGMRLVSFAVFFILARLLSPADFGLVALASVYIAFISVFVEHGFAAAIIQRDEVDAYHLDTAFWSGLTFAMIFSLASVAFAVLIGNVMDEPQIVGPIRWLSLSFILIALTSVQQALLRRDLEFRELAVRNMIATAAGGGVGVAMAFQGWGVWSLVSQMLVTRAVGVIVLWQLCDWRPGRRLSRRHFDDLFHFNIHVVGAKIIAFFSRRADDFLIGIFLGTVALGFYTIAYRTLTLLTQLLVQAANAVALPAFSRLQHQRPQLISTFHKATQYSSAVAFPLFLGVAALAPEVVPLVYGQQWGASIPVVRILMLVGALHAITFFHGAAITAVGHPEWRLRLMILTTVLILIGFWIAMPWGISAIAAAYVIGNYLVFPLELIYTQRLVGLEIAPYLRRFIPIITACCAMLAAIAIAKRLTAGNLTLLVQFLLYASIGAAAYLSVLWMLIPKLFLDVFRLVRMLRLGKPSRSAAA